MGLGVSIASNSLDTAGKEDIDSNGTIDATKNVSDDIFWFKKPTKILNSNKDDKYAMIV